MSKRVFEGKGEKDEGGGKGVDGRWEKRKEKGGECHERRTYMILVLSSQSLFI